MSFKKKETYFGYKVHDLITLQDFITAFEITPALADDREGLRDMVYGQSGFGILGDSRRMETVFSQLNEQLHAQRVRAKSFHGLCTRMVNKILAYNLCLMLNYLFYPDRSIGTVKHLIFSNSSPLI